VKQMYFIL